MMPPPPVACGSGCLGGIIGATGGIICIIFVTSMLMRKRAKVAAIEAQKGLTPEEVVADSIFSQVAGRFSATISRTELTDYLVKRGDIPLPKIPEIFAAVDTDGSGSIDRKEWRAGFFKGLVPTPPGAESTPVEKVEPR